MTKESTMPETVDIEIYRGDTFYRILRFRDDTTGNFLDLTSCVPEAQIRTTAVATGTLIADFDCDLLDQNTDPGAVSIRLSPLVTAALTTGGFWDFQLTHPDGTVRTYLKGSVSLDGEVTV